MKIELDEVEEIINTKVRKSKKGTSCYIYLPAEYEGKTVKICVLKQKK